MQVKHLLDEVERVKGLEAARRREAELLQGSEAALLAKGALYRQAITVLVSPTPAVHRCGDVTVTCRQVEGQLTGRWLVASLVWSHAALCLLTRPDAVRLAVTGS